MPFDPNYDYIYKMLPSDIDRYNKYQQLQQSQQKDLPGASVHEVKKAMFEDYNVPGHEPRTASSLYSRTHDSLIVKKDTPCYICGVSNSTLSDSSKNLVGAKALETHHFIVEWSLANAIDWAQVKVAHPDFTGWADLDESKPETFYVFVDSEYNMLVLCDIHHRGKLRGIHAIEYPVWLGQKFVKPDFSYINLPTDSKTMEELLPDMD
jgi:hypothetical protein